MEKARLNLRVDALLAHYLPLWLSLIVAVVPVLMFLVAVVPLRSEDQFPNEQLPLFTACGGLQASQSKAIIPDILLAMFAFWIWALTTNAHGGLLARTGGRSAGTKKQRSEEVATIIFFAAITGIAFVIANLKISNLMGTAALMFPTILPLWFLGLPRSKP